MTDQNQFKDPQTNGGQQDDQNTEETQDAGVFGGSDDIFENSEILEPIIDENNKNDENTDDNNIDTFVDTTEKENTDEIKPEIVEEIPKLEPIEELDDEIIDNKTEEKSDIKIS